MCNFYILICLFLYFAAYLFNKKYKYIFKENKSELIQPSSRDVQIMSLDEIKETADDRKRTLLK